MALESISELTLSSQDYSKAIELLKHCYENQKILKSSYIEQSVNLETAAKSDDVFRLRKLFNKFENTILNLRGILVVD